MKALVLVFAIASVCGSLSVLEDHIWKESYRADDLPQGLTHPDCRDHIKCGSAPFVAKCKTQCVPDYYYCSSPGATPSPQECPDGQVFNPVLSYAKCVLEGNCPYIPPWNEPTTKSTKPTKPTTTNTPTTTKTTTTTPTTTPTTTSTTTTPTTTPTTTSTITFTTTTTTTTPPSTPTMTPGCIESLVCNATGDFPKCPYCFEKYFHCANPGDVGTIVECSPMTLFNPDEAYPFCVMYTDCPHSLP